MILTFILKNDLEKMGAFYNVSTEALMNKTLRELDSMEKDMEAKKQQDICLRNAEDLEFARLVKKFFTPYEFLSKWWTEEEIISACARHMTKGALTEEFATKRKDCFLPDAEFIRRDWAFLPRYAKNGEQLMESERAMCNIFRIKNQYQGLNHGEVIEDLLYTKYPQLKEFGFEAYEYNSYTTYEIYSKNRIYTPFEALMNGDIETIKERNIKYAEYYNAGDYTYEKVQGRLTSEEAQHYFEVIANLKH